MSFFSLQFAFFHRFQITDTTANTSRSGRPETAATTKVTAETTADGNAKRPETVREEVVREAANTENVIETDTIVIETMTRTEIGTTIEVRTDDRVVIVDGNENRKTENLGTGTGVIAKIAQIGMKGIPSSLHKNRRVENDSGPITQCTNYIVHVVMLTVKEVRMGRLSEPAVRKLLDIKANRRTTRS